MIKRDWAVPYAFTVANLFCGILAMAYGLNRQIVAASWLIIIAGLMDGLDGKIARFTGASTRFGVEFDSMADLVSFGFAPAVLLYTHAFASLGSWGWFVMFLYVLAGAYRLARFNFHFKGIRKDSFEGLPITMAGMTIAAHIIFISAILAEMLISSLLVILTVILSALMVSTLPYEGLPQFSMQTRKDKVKMIVLACCAGAMAIQPSLVLFPLLVAYLFLGPVEWAIVTLSTQAHFRSNIHIHKKTKRE